MSALRFSKASIISGLYATDVLNSVYPFLSLNSSGPFGKWTNGGFASATGFNFALFKGALPTQAEIDAAVSVTATNPPAFRSSDALIRYRTAPDDVKGRNSLVTLSHNTWMYAPPASTAIESGEATWFAFMNPKSSDMLIGSVSAQGAGGEMQLVTTTFVKDQMYAMPPWIMSIPRTLEV